MTRYILIPFLLFACAVEEIDDADVAASESGDAESDDEFRSGPVFDSIPEAWDKCCPVTASGQQDSLCGDDVANACPAATFPVGGGITSWSVINCFTCGVNSHACSNTRWVDHGAFGFECGGTSVKRTSNALIDDDCSTQACTQAYSGGAYPMVDCNGICGQDWPGDDGAGCMTGSLDGSSGLMCCTDSNAQNCVPPITEGGIEGCTHSDPNLAAWYLANGYTRKTWCVHCDGATAASEADGNWDLISDPGDGDEFEQSVWCSQNINVSWNPGWDGNPTRYACGGFAFLSTGASFTESCANYP
jgi:hypothetical protein